MLENKGGTHMERDKLINEILAMLQSMDSRQIEWVYVFLDHLLH